MNETERTQRLAAVRERAGKMNMYQICHETGLTPGQVTWIAQTNGISLAFYQRNPELSAKQQQTIVEMHAKGHTAKQIGEALGVTVKHAERMIRNMRKDGADLPPRPHGGYRNGYIWSPEATQQLKDMYAEGYGGDEIAAKLPGKPSKAVVHRKTQALRNAGELDKPEGSRVVIWTPEKLALLKRLWVQDVPLQEIADQINPGMMPESVRARVSLLRAQGENIPHRSRKPLRQNKNM